MTPLSLLLLLIAAFLGSNYFSEHWQKQTWKEQIVQSEDQATDLQKDLEKRKESIATPQRESLRKMPHEDSQRMQQKENENGLVLQEPIGREESKSSDAAADSPSEATYALIERPQIEPLAEREVFASVSSWSTPPGGRPVSGAVAIIATLRPPHEPPFVSFPSMELDEYGSPVNLRKGLRFRIARFKYMWGGFDFPFAAAKSFRLLVYASKDQLADGYQIPAEKLRSIESA